MFTRIDPFITIENEYRFEQLRADYQRSRPLPRRHRRPRWLRRRSRGPVTVPAATALPRPGAELPARGTAPVHAHSDAA